MNEKDRKELEAYRAKKAKRQVQVKEYFARRRAKEAFYKAYFEKNASKEDKANLENVIAKL